MLFITLLKGIAVGIVIALPVGPVGVLCVRRTLFEGARFGFISGMGAATADATFGGIAGFGFTFIRDWLLSYEDWFGLAGGVFLLVIGTKALFVRHPAEPEPLGDEAMVTAFASTFALTIANPITLLSFAVIFAKVGAASITGIGDVSILVGGVFLGSLLWWLGLSFGIASLKHMAGAQVMLWLNRVSGTILLGSGVILVILAGIGLT
jgi:threonine/homoserine/homoserine lactone efflux protein